LEQTGDSFVIRAWKPSAFPVHPRKDDKVITSWVDKTHRAVIKEEEQRIFGKEFDIQDTREPGLLYDVVPKKAKPRKKQSEPEIHTRNRGFSGAKAAASPMSCRDRRVEIRGAGMEQSGEANQSRRTGLGGYTVHLLFPGHAKTTNGVVLDKAYTREQIVLKTIQLFKLPPIREEYVEIA
jgi:hypothetical protein